MSIQARILYSLSQAGQRDSLRQGGDGKVNQTLIGEIQPADVDVFDVDQDGNLSFNATTSPEDCATTKYHSVASIMAAKSGRVVKVVWDVVPTWDELLDFGRWAAGVERAREAEEEEMREAAQEAEEKGKAEAAAAFLADPNARAYRIEEDWVTIDGWHFWIGGEPESADEAPREAVRRHLQDHEDRRKANRNTLASWVKEHGSANQRQRLAAGLLPWQEAHDSMENHVFAPLEEFPRYERFNVEEICVCERDGNAPCGVKFQSTDATVLNADEWDRYSAISSALPDAQFQLREHRAKCKSRTDTEMKRGVIVKITVDLLTFKREFALGGTHELS